MDVLSGRRFVRTALDVLSGRTCLRRFVRKTFCQDRLRRFVRKTFCQDRLTGGHILGISRAYLGHFLGISWAYLGHMLGISLAYLGHIFGISWVYLGHILGISWAYISCCHDWLSRLLSRLLSLHHLAHLVIQFLSFLKVVSSLLGGLWVAKVGFQQLKVVIDGYEPKICPR